MHKPLKKVLILSYYFLPANFAGSYRIASWAKHLHKFGWYPIIITRQWNEGQSDITDQVKNNKLVIEKNEFCEIHKIPYNQNFRDKIHHNYGSKKLSILRRSLSFIEIILQNFTISVIPYRNMYYYAQNLMKTNTDIKIILASGRPFQLFYFAGKLSKKTKIAWLADYRDEWSTTQWKSSLNLWEKIVLFFDGLSEKKWLQSSQGIISCSSFLTSSIGKFNKKMGYNILNGFEPSDYPDEVPLHKNADIFKIVYNGTLYSTQQIEIVIDACKEIWNDKTISIKLQLVFQGITADPNQFERLNKLIIGYEEYVIIGSRVSKNEVINIQKSADLLLMLAHKNIIGNYSSKIFEYLACKVPILLAPSDNDVMEELIYKTNSGYIAKDKEKIVLILKELFKLKENKIQIPYLPNVDKILEYTRECQVEKLSEALDSVIQHPHNSNKNNSRLRSLLFSLFYFLNIDNILRLQKKGRITVLCFHRITYETDLSYPPMQPHVFEGIIKYCIKHYQFIRPEEINIPTKKSKLLLTFDDGYADFIDYAMPIIEQYQIPCIMSIVSDTVKTGKPFWTQRIGALINNSIVTNVPISDPLSKNNIIATAESAENISLMLFDKLITLKKEAREEWLYSQEIGREIYYPKMLDKSQVIELDKKGVIFASHSKTHAYMPSEAEQGNFDFITEELIQSKKYIEQLLNKPCNIYSAPSGCLHPLVAKLAIDKAGYDYLLSTKEDFYNAAKIETEREIPRILMYRNNIAENIFRLECFHKNFSKNG
jgi:peptidoglycan/xylan/chitin deacetylase (PgdA/CDA1 family)